MISLSAVARTRVIERLTQLCPSISKGTSPLQWEFFLSAFFGTPKAARAGAGGRLLTDMVIKVGSRFV